MSLLPFHFTIAQKKDEGIYTLHLYSVPYGTKKQLEYHYSAINDNSHFPLPATPIAPTVLAPSMLDSLGPIAIATESEYEQSVPSVQTLKVSLASRPELVPLVEAARSTEWEVWALLALEQPVLDARVSIGASSFLWPAKRHHVFWGILNASSLHDKPSIQRFVPHARVGRPTAGVTNAIVRMDKNHIGALDMEFIAWMKAHGDDEVITSLDELAGIVPGGGYLSLGQVMLELINAFSPTLFKYLADHRLVPIVQGVELTGHREAWGQLEIALNGSEALWFSNLWDIYIKIPFVGGVLGGLLFKPVPPAAADQTSFYRWTTIAQGIAEMCRELFLTLQGELPNTWSNGAGVDYDEWARFLIMPLEAAVLNAYIDENQDGIDMNPAAAYASNYKITEPSTTDLFPQPPYSTIASPMKGGSDQSYTTLFRFMGSSVVGGASVDSPRGWELYVRNDANTDYIPVRKGWDLISQGGVPGSGGLPYTDWTTLHAVKRYTRWGMPRAVCTIQGAGVGIAPFGADLPAGIAAPQKTFLLWDWAYFPLHRKITIEPGIFSTVNDDVLEANGVSTARLFTAIGCTRTPGAGIEWKLIEIPPSSFTLPPVNGPSTAAGSSGSRDVPGVTITNPTGAPISGTVAVKVVTSNQSGVSQVTMAIDGILFQTRVTTPNMGDAANTEWDLSLDTTKLTGSVASPVTHVLTILAYDLHGNAGVATLTITVRN